MSRREIKTQVADKSVEKKKRDELVASIAVETGVRDGLKKEIESLNAEYKKAKEDMAELEVKVEFWKKATVDAERIFKEWESKAKEMHSSISEAEVRIAALNKDENIAKNNLSRMQVESAGEMAQIHNQVEAEKKRIDATFVSLMGESSQLEQRVEVLKKTENSIIDEITNKRVEVKSLDEDIVKAKSTLSQVNMDIEGARRAYRAAQNEITRIDTQLTAVKAELTQKDIEIAKKTTDLTAAETEVTTKKEQLLALAAKEKRVQDLIPAVRELYRAAGLSINI